MKKIDKTVLSETAYIAVWVIILSALMQAVFLISDMFIEKFQWDYTFLLGNLLSALAAVGNFFLMGLTVQKAVLKEEKDARSAMKVSQLYRTLLLLVVCIIGVVLPVFSTWTVLIPLFFPRIAIMFRPLFDKKRS